MQCIAGMLCAGLLAAAPLVAPAGEPAPHQHGVARLEVAVDGPVLSFFLDCPLDNLLGFEHYPRNESERAAVRALGDRLRAAQTVFATPPAARCAPTSVRLKSPVFESKPPAASAGGHADLEAEFVFHCEAPEHLRSVDVRLFAGFPNMRRIDVQLAARAGQVGTKLDAASETLRW